MRTSIKMKLTACCMATFAVAVAEEPVIPESTPHPDKVYDYAWNCNDGKLIVGNNPFSDEWRCTIIGLDGKPLLKGEYGEIIGPDKYGYYSVKGTDGSQMWLTKDLELIKQEKHPAKPHELKQTSDDEYYILDKNGKHKLKMPKNCYAEWLTEERIIYREVKGLPSDDLDLIDYEAHYGVMDIEGNTVVPAQYAMIYPYSEGVAMITKDKALWGGIDRNGNIVIPFTLHIPVSYNADDDSTWDFHEGLITVSNITEDDETEDETEKIGFADKTGKIVIPHRYEDAYDFKNGMARVYNDEREYYIDKKGNKIDSINVESIYPETDTNNKVKYIGSDSAEVLPAIYDDGTYFTGEYALVKVGEHWHLIDRTGRVILRDIAFNVNIYPG